MTPAVSVIMPVRNAGEFLAPAVNSILGQTLTELELILVDDHSDDSAIGRLDRSDERLSIIRNSGEGVSSAFNTGVKKATAPLIARMDGDDLALPERLEAQRRHLERHPELGICGACVEIFSADGVADGNRRYQTWLNACRSPDRMAREIFIESPIPNPTAMFRTEVLDALGGYGDPPWPEDYDLFLRADREGVRMGKPPEILLRWRDHEARLTRSDGRYDLARFQAAKIHHLAGGRLKGEDGVIVWGAGPTGRLTHDLLWREGVRIHGFLEIHPRRIGREKRGLPVWSIHDDERLGAAFVLVAVGSAGAREKIRRHMQQMDRQEGKHYLFVA